MIAEEFHHSETSLPPRDNIGLTNRVLQTVCADKEYVAPLLKELHEHDRETALHSIRVAELLVETSEQLGFSSERQILLGRAGLLHDIGKINISQATLQGAHKLSDVERGEIERHPVVAFERLKQLNDACAPIVLFHHTMQRNPYPRDIDFAELEEQDLLLEATVLAVADQVDALMTPRTYRPIGFAPNETIDLVSEHDAIPPELVEPFTQKYLYLYRQQEPTGGSIVQ